MPDTAAVTYELDGNVAVLRLDDGKANAIGHEIAEGLSEAFDRAVSDGAGALALIGRPGRFSAGFDLKVMQSGPKQARDLLRVGAELAIELYQFPMPTVLGVTGHALAMGAILLMSADSRIGARGEYKIGLNEVAIGMPVPGFAVELAEDRLSRRHLTASVNLAEVFDPSTAVEANYLDSVVDLDDVESTALARAHELAERVKPTAFVMTRTNLRAATVARLRDRLATDLQTFTVDQA